MFQGQGSGGGGTQKLLGGAGDEIHDSLAAVVHGRPRGFVGNVQDVVMDASPHP